MNNFMGERPGGDWGDSVYEFTRLYLQEKRDRVNVQDEELDEFIKEYFEDDYPERVDDPEEFFDYCQDIRDRIDEVLEE